MNVSKIASNRTSNILKRLWLRLLNDFDSSQIQYLFIVFWVWAFAFFGGGVQISLWLVGNLWLTWLAKLISYYDEWCWWDCCCLFLKLIKFKRWQHFFGLLSVAQSSVFVFRSLLITPSHSFLNTTNDDDGACISLQHSIRFFWKIFGYFLRYFYFCCYFSFCYLFLSVLLEFVV